MTTPTDRGDTINFRDTPPTETVPVLGYGDLRVTSTRDEEVVKSLTHVLLPQLTRAHPGDYGKWKLSLYPDEALALGMALIRHAGHMLTT